jgi:hypothetical protein
MGICSKMDIRGAIVAIYFALINPLVLGLATIVESL